MLDLLKTPEGKRLLELEDPWSYRDRLTLPKLIVNGTNDRYWTQDALNIYWDDLTGPKWVLYVPNSGHGLEDRARVTSTLAAFVHSVARGGLLPKISWRYEKRDGGAVELMIESDQPLVEARLFHCESKTHDFRDSRWSYETMNGEGTRWGMKIPAPAEGNQAVYGEAVFGLDGARFTLSTQIRILDGPAAPAKKKFY
jgi:PhoPQ-activated pathogenicity-related protein